MVKSRVKLPFSVALRMIGDYAGDRLRQQIKAVAFIVIYLVAFQMLVFGRAPHQALRMAGGIGVVVLGLTLFLEGLILGIMPLAQRVGVQLSARGGLRIIIPIGFLIGLGATFAEPAVAALRSMGSEVVAWDAPLLFLLLQRKPEWLIAAIAVGVGVAVALSLLRFYFGLSIKPFILTVMGILLPLSYAASRVPNLASILGLAWDAGAVTTGAVTVPLVLALGIGISRSSGKAKGAVSGFGAVALALPFSIIAVIALSAFLAPRVPAASGEREFFAPENRAQAVTLFGSEEALESYAFKYGSDETRMLFLRADGSEDPQDQAVAPVDRHAMPPFFAMLRVEATYAARAVLPLTAFLILILLVLLRERPRYLDEVLLGIVFALVGMCLFTTGNQIGLSQLGKEVGSRLPQVYRDVQVEKGQIAIDDFDPSVLVSAVGQDGKKIEVFHLLDGESVQVVKFQPEWYDSERHIYTHRVHMSPLTHPELSRVGVLLILLFAFGVGYGATVAEPALNALARTVEDLSVGTIKSVSIVRAVSVGVGIGLLAGVIRILYDIPMIWMLLPPYLLLFPLTLANEEEFAGIAWDSGGVVTGLVTVPLVLAMGLGLSGQLDTSDGFGILAMASAYPVVSVLLFGLGSRLRRHKVARVTEGGGDNV